MVRGTPGVKRNRTISVRVSETEWAAWDARREASGRREMGAWVRAVVLDAEGLGTVGVAGSRAGDVPVVPEVNEVAYAALVGAANNLNQLTRYSHQEEALAAGVAAAVAEVVAAARAVRGRRVLQPGESADPAAPAVEPVESVEPTEIAVEPGEPDVAVDPWVSPVRRRGEPVVVSDDKLDVDASGGGGSSTPAPSVGADEGRRPVGWESMSLGERARWLQDSGSPDQR